MSVQTTLNYPIHKKINFYGIKQNTPTQDFSNASITTTPTTKYTPTVKKIVDISDDSESDSDTENTATNNTALHTPKRKPKNNVASKNEYMTPKRKSNKEAKDDSSPPKQTKWATPSRILDEKLQELVIISPSPEKNDKSLKSHHLEPKNLFSNHKYSEARKALHSEVPENLVGRDEEIVKLEKFIQKHFDKKSSGSLYVSGPPGTGKTACLSKLMLKPKFKNNFQIVYVNCMSTKTAATIYSHIVEELKLKSQKNSKSNKTAIEQYLVQNHKMLLFVLDEIDQLETKNQSILYSIFEWPSIPKSKLVLVGIANALDLTDRILPRLQAKCELKPTLLHFKPYSKQQIMDIITDRLKEANVLDVFSTKSMQLLAAKVAAVSGDIRRALDIGKKVIELVEADKMVQANQSNNESDPNSSNPLSEYGGRCVDFKEVRTVLNGVYGGSQNVDSEENNFPIQQKILLCSLMLILNKEKNKDVNISKLYQVYSKVCKKRTMPNVDMSEFVSLCSLVETRGIISLKSKKEIRLSKVSLQWDQEILTQALQDKVLTFEIINDESCL